MFTKLIDFSCDQPPKKHLWQNFFFYKLTLLWNLKFSNWDTVEKTHNLKTEEKNCEKLKTYIMTKLQNSKYNQIKKIVKKTKKIKLISVSTNAIFTN